MLLLPCFLFPLVFCCAATPFLEGPGVVSLTRRVVLPTPRRSDSQGTAQSWAGAWMPPFWGFCRHFLSARGSQGPSDACVRDLSVGEGALFSAPSGPTFHTHLFSRPRFFFGPRGHACLGELDATDATQRLEFVFRERNIEFLELSVYTPEKPRRVSPKTPAAVWISYLIEGETLSVFLGEIFWRLSLLILRFSKVRSILGFFFRRVFRHELWNGSPGFFGRFFGPKNAHFASRKRRRRKFSLS